jgi:hypothetical protein
VERYAQHKQRGDSSDAFEVYHDLEPSFWR